MSASQHARDTGRTNWRRFSMMFGLSAAASAGALALIADGAVAAGLQVSGQSFKVSADRLVADGFVQYGGVNARMGFDEEPAQVAEPVAASAMRTATLTNLCQSVLIKNPFLGNIVLRIEAGKNPDKPVRAKNMVVDMNQMDGNAVFTNMEIGVDASLLDKGPVEKGKGDPGMFAQQADHVEIDNLKQVAWATTAGEFSLTGLSLKVGFKQKECF